jgi:hypothetical protein
MAEETTYTTAVKAFLVKTAEGYLQINPTTVDEAVMTADGNLKTALAGINAAITEINQVILAVQEELAGDQKVHVVDDIAARDAIEDPKQGELAYVVDATGDATVAAGWAKYIFDGEYWRKFAEGESLDVTLEWDAIQGKPSSAPEEIDAAVANVASLIVVSGTEPAGQPEGGLWIKPVDGEDSEEPSGDQTA